MARSKDASEAASLLARRRNRKLGTKGLSDMALKASRLKTRIYGPDWMTKIQRGERLVPVPPPQEGEN